MASTTVPTRVPGRVHAEVEIAARLTGRNASELLGEAWTLLKRSPAFETELREAQSAFAAGDLDRVTDLMIGNAAKSASRRIRDARSD